MSYAYVQQKIQYKVFLMNNSRGQLSSYSQDQHLIVISKKTWGWKVYRNNPHTLEALQIKVWNVVLEIMED
jgi:hypothetical protein